MFSIYCQFNFYHVCLFKNMNNNWMWRNKNWPFNDEQLITPQKKKKAEQYPVIFKLWFNRIQLCPLWMHESGSCFILYNVFLKISCDVFLFRRISCNYLWSSRIVCANCKKWFWGIFPYPKPVLWIMYPTIPQAARSLSVSSQCLMYHFNDCRISV